MNKLNWCTKKKGGIELIEPNFNLAEAYTRKAEESLQTMRVMTSKSWKIVTTYYAMYFSVYSILMRIGVKCEIHSCTIEFAKVFLDDYMKSEELKLLADSMEARVDAQYYVNREVSSVLFKKMIDSAPEFIAHGKSVKEKIDDKTVTQIREKLENIIRKEK